MNVYDFDKTIYPGDSALHFWLFCVRRHPAALLTLPRAGWKALRSIGAGDCKTGMKQEFFRYLLYIPDLPAEVNAFWDGHLQRIYPWYLAQRRDDDVIISASPEFLLRPICDELGVRLIGTRMDKYSGKISGENCHDKEKVRRFYEEFPGACTEEFYSDSLSDTPMAEIAQRAYLVRKEKLSSWPF